MRIAIVGLHAPNAPRLRALLGPAHAVDALAAFPAAGELRVDVVVANRVTADEARRLRARLLQVPGAGAEQIALDALPPGTTVCNVHGHEVPIAEFVLHAVLEHSLQPWAWPVRLDAEAFARSYAQRPQHRETIGATLAIVGFGHIGREIARRARAFGLHVVAVTRGGRARDGGELADEHVAVGALAALLPRVDMLVLCCPLNDATRGLIGARELAALPDGALLVNVARAEVVDEAALYEAMRRGRPARAVLDVWYRYPTPGEPPVAPSRFPLHELPNVRATPHVSAMTPGLLERRYAFIAANVVRLLEARPLENVIRPAA